MNQIVNVNARGMLEPKTFEDAMRFSSMLAKSTMVPRDFQGKPENILVAVQWGREIGLGPLQALQSVAVINGRPSVWGDALLALVRGSGLAAFVRETMEGDGEHQTAICRTQRRDDPSEIIGSFSVADAKKAGLWGKAGPWTQYPNRMLQLRARGFCLRDAYPDVLRGVISAEEAQDIPTEPLRQPETFTGQTIEGRTEPAPPAAPTPRRTTRQWLAELEQDLIKATEAGPPAVEARLARDDVQAAMGALQNGALAELQRLVGTARGSYQPSGDTLADDAAFLGPGERMET